MRGDFSSWRNERNQNFSGVLHQQGRVLLDSDWNAQTQITNDWQDTEALDVIGSGVAAVPADLPDSYKVTAATYSASGVMLTVTCGRVWVDGMLVTLPGTGTRQRVATYLEPPIQSPAGTVGSIGAGTRDAVVLDVWREEINGFQLESLLVERALGGPDTTERLYTSSAFKLYRMGPNDTCESILAHLQDDFSSKGTLAVTLNALSMGGDCPVVIGGGYTGFEHNLYRIEIAATNTPNVPRFKWSQYNGGIVGRGTFDGAHHQIAITDNVQAIVNSGLTSFYLEVVERNPADLANPGLGHWRVLCGADATLDANGDLILPATAAAYMYGAPPANGDLFFRLWNGIARVADFVTTLPTPPNQLAFGINLDFSTADPGHYTAGDYWTFQVRAAEIDNGLTLIDNKPPEGPHHHRVSLGVITWNGSGGTQSIGDCRRIFQPLTRLSTCCTYRVGDGVRSHGQFTSIQQAINALPPDGGEVCVLPGIYRENILIQGKENITVNGCGARTRIVSPQADDAANPLPIVTVEGCTNITLNSFAVEAHTNGVGVMLNGLPINFNAESIIPLGDPLINVTLHRLLISAAKRSAVEAHVVTRGSIRDCRIRMKDTSTPWPGIFLAAEDFIVEGNVITVAADPPAGATEPLPVLLDTPLFMNTGRGGIQIAGTSERVLVVENLIRGGIGNGITLGSLVAVHTRGGDGGYVGWVVNTGDPCSPGSSVIVDGRTPADGGTEWQSAGDLYEIGIERNLILDMGLNGIGPVAFFTPGTNHDLISIHGLRIEGNEIRRCLNRDIADIDPAYVGAVAYGAIVLPDVEDLVVLDNVIADVGSDATEPACGLFVLHGEGMEIMRNRIAVYPLLRAPNRNPALKPGLRAGIAVVAVSSHDPEVQRARDAVRPAPVATIHDNRVSTWLGTALTVIAQCELSVTDNELETSGLYAAFGLTSTVFILDLGMNVDLIWLLLVQLSPDLRRYLICNQGRLTFRTPDGGEVPVFPLPRVPRGNLLFAHNQCRLNLEGTTSPFFFSSALIASLDDVNIHGNQFDCAIGTNLMLNNLYAVGGTLRVADNRLREGLQNAFLSAFTLGLANSTIDNTSDHCLMIRGIPTLVEDVHNTILMQFICENACEEYGSKFMRGFTRQG
ncbi:MAG TPA: DUF6519 domain-containing protein [Candidatus Kapabacteria bacterium]|nr:DUF6519 domain-containing protein [Candidatus Kapabacteria bacterium]